LLRIGKNFTIVIALYTSSFDVSTTTLRFAEPVMVRTGSLSYSQTREYPGIHILQHYNCLILDLRVSIGEAFKGIYRILFLRLAVSVPKKFLRKDGSSSDGDHASVVSEMLLLGILDQRSNFLWIEKAIAKNFYIIK
jgi:hypothetical protein